MCFHDSTTEPHDALGGEHVWQGWEDLVTQEAFLGRVFQIVN